MFAPSRAPVAGQFEVQPPLGLVSAWNPHSLCGAAIGAQPVVLFPAVGYREFAMNNTILEASVWDEFHSMPRLGTF